MQPPEFFHHQRLHFATLNCSGWQVGYLGHLDVLRPGIRQFDSAF